MCINTFITLQITKFSILILISLSLPQSVNTGGIKIVKIIVIGGANEINISDKLIQISNTYFNQFLKGY